MGIQNPAATGYCFLSSLGLSKICCSYTSAFQDPDAGKTRIKLPSGARKTVSNLCRAMVGIVAGGGRIDKPLLKAGNSYHKYKVRSFETNNRHPTFWRREKLRLKRHTIPRAM
jgi:hypothetical protein